MTQLPRKRVKKRTLDMEISTYMNHTAKYISKVSATEKRDKGRVGGPAKITQLESLTEH